MLISETEFNTCELIVGNLEVVESDITNMLSNGSISSILPTSQIPEVSCDSWVCMEWIFCIAMVVGDRFARVLPWYHIMEDTEAISTARVSMIVPKLSYSLILRAHISAEAHHAEQAGWLCVPEGYTPDLDCVVTEPSAPVRLIEFTFRLVMMLKV